MTISANYPSINPSLDLDFANSVALDPRVTFTRAGTGTYYDGSTSAIAEQNLLTYSQQFDNSIWTKNSTTYTANTQTAPDGTTTAGTFTSSSSIATAYINQTISNVLGYALSFYAKAGTSNFACITTNSVGCYANFNISTGAVASSANCTAAITLSSNGWYRCTITGVQSGIYFMILGKDADPAAQPYNTGTWTSGNYIYLWGAQLEQHTGVGVYTPTTTATITNYIPQLLTAPANTPRFDFNPTTRASLGLLMEQQSTNLLTYSQDYSQASWTKSNTTVNSTANISPDGTLNANKLIPNTTSTTHSVQETTNTVGTGTFSFYAKAGEYSGVIYQNTGGVGVGFSLITGQRTGGDNPTWSSVNIGNGWWRFSISGIGTNSIHLIHVSNTSTPSYPASFSGDGTSGIYVWGAQCESTAFPTSYIPTVASQVTRAQDFATMTGTNFSSWFNNQQGTVYCSFDSASIGAPAMSYWAIDNNSNVGYYANRATGSATLTVFEGSASATAGTITANTTQQNAYSYNNTSGSLAASGLLNGGSIGTITPVQLSFLPTQLSLGKHISNTSPMTGHIRKFAYYPIATTTAQMQTLTGS